MKEQNHWLALDGRSASATVRGSLKTFTDDPEELDESRYEQKKAIFRDWHRRNKDAENRRCAEWRAKNKERVAEYYKQWVKENRERYNASRREYYYRNYQKRRAYLTEKTREYRKKAKEGAGQ